MIAYFPSINEPKIAVIRRTNTGEANTDGTILNEWMSITGRKISYSNPF